MKKMKKHIALLLALVMALSLLTACGSKTETPADTTAAGATEKESDTPETAEVDPDEKVTITFLGAAYSDGTEPYLKQVVADFEDENPNITVNLEIVGWDNIGTRAAALVGAGQAPDLYNGGSASEYVPDDLLYEVTDIISEDLQNDIYETFWNNNIDPDVGGVYALPYVASVRALYCNSTIFEEVGIEKAPTTWAEVEEACAQIKEYYNGGVYGWGLNATTTEGQTMIAYYGWSNGGGYVDESGEYAINSAANVEGLEWAYSLYQNGYTNENPSLETRDDLQKLFAEDKLAMLVTACFFPALYPDLDMEIAPIPYNDANQSASSTLAVQDGLMIFNGNAKGGEDSPAKKAAIAKFCDFFYSAERYTDFMVQEGLLPATKSGAERLAEISPDQAAYIDVLEGAKFYARNRVDWREMTTELIANEQSVFAGALTPQQALDATQNSIS